MKYSDFGKRFNRYSAITHLMDDLSAGLLDDEMVMLGGGNPAVIPAAVEMFQQTLDELQSSDKLVNTLINYDASQGNQAFLQSLADYFNERYNWGVSSKNIALTHGSQSAFFALFNSFAGRCGSTRRHVLLPITPEYIGYSDLGIEDRFFVSHKPRIEMLDDQFFKYHIDFDGLEISADTGLICVSRPTNPSGNVLTDDECRHLDELARHCQVPLMVDNAYGTPFPQIVFNQASPFWNDNTIVCLSLSKLGLPGVRTGIVVANEDVISHLSNMTAITSLAPGGTGPVLVNHLLQLNRLDNLCEDVIRPFYQQRCQRVVKWLKQSVSDRRLRIHVPEGAIFLWLWFEGLSISTSQLYEELKKEGLLVLPGKYFFPGQGDPGDHAESCIRMNYVQSEEDLQKGIEILSRTLKRFW